LFPHNVIAARFVLEHLALVDTVASNLSATGSVLSEMIPPLFLYAKRLHPHIPTRYTGEIVDITVSDIPRSSDGFPSPNNAVPSFLAEEPPIQIHSTGDDGYWQWAL